MAAGLTPTSQACSSCSRQDELILRAGVGWSPDDVGVRHIPAGPSSQGGYTLTTSPVIMRDAARERRFEISPLMAAQGIASGLSASIRSHGGTYGIIGAHTYAQRDFSDHDVSFLEAVASPGERLSRRSPKRRASRRTVSKR
jgi:GAF domain-containing protein